ncbi:MAG: type VI secretion system contractile sheath small subunit [Planctomycetes bacterium]|nr:type VI secretion system contractile sheath small subunit [Planctomycetota bacterium]
MASESLQHKLDRVRKPRVQITYDVEIEGAIQKKELPFVVGVLADLSGNAPETPLKALGDRKFVDIDRDNFNAVMAGIKPRLTFRVPDKLTGDGSSLLNVELNFRSLDDFSPERVAEQVPPLKKLLEARGQLKELLAKLDGDTSGKLDDILLDVMQNTEKQNALKQALGGDEKKEG